jgi:hypothetical protein
VLEKIGAVAYKLELPEDANIHLVFHVSFLKAKVGQSITPLHKLPPVDSLGHLAPEPTKILETRVVKKRRLPAAVTEVLVQWEGLPRKMQHGSYYTSCSKTTHTLWARCFKWGEGAMLRP